MIIQCDKCNTKYRIDDSRVSGAGVKVKCTKCQNVFIVMPPDEAPVEEIFGSIDSGASGADQPQASAKADSPNLRFDFQDETPEEKTSTDQDRQEAPPEPHEGPSSFNDIDFSFNVDSKEQAASSPFENDGLDSGPEDDSPFREQEGAPKDEDTSFEDFDFGTETEKSSPEKSMPDEIQDDWGLNGPQDDEDEPEPTPKAPEPPKPVEAKAKPEPALSAAASAYSRAKAPAPAMEDLFKEDDKDDFADLLSDSLKGEMKPPAGTEVGEGEEEGLTAAEEKKPAKKPALLIAALVFILGGAFIYFSGIIDSLAKRLTPSAQTSTSVRNVEIESINGYYVENKLIGNFFVIEARLKNTSDEPQPIKRVTGTVYDEKGEKLSSRSVAPGRVVAPEDLKSLPKEDLLKQFKDPSGGTVPPKGTVPVMMLFTELPAGVAEYGVDVAR